MRETDSDTQVGDASVPNPYVGPRCFETADAGLFFGRENEVSELRSLIISRQAVLLYAASGTGKSSLLKAGLIPSLARDYPSLRVLPVARVSTEATRSALLDGLRPAVAKALADEEAEAVLMIVDQFEEVFTHEPDAEGPRRSFLAGLGQALRELPQLTLLLGLREDFLAQLDPYLDLFPDRLRSHFRLELLSPAAALAAVAKPADGAGVPFTPEAARALVEDLGRSRSQAMAGEVVEVKGSPVDPVQLQVVCQRLWVERDPGAKVLDSALVEQHGKVDNALSAFYDDRVGAVAKETGAEERLIRDWFQRELITPQGIRKQAQREAIATARLPNAVVEALEDAHLLRAERRRGVVFYELAHDRLVTPVQESNRRWARANATFLEGWVRAWEGSGQSKKVLLVGKELMAAREEAKRLGKLAPEGVEAFLEASKDKDRQRRRRNRLLACLAAAAAGVFAIAFIGLAAMLLLAVAAPNLAFEQARANVLRDREQHLDSALLEALAANRLGDQFRDWLLEETEVDRRHALQLALTAEPQLERLFHYQEASTGSKLIWSMDGEHLGLLDVGGNDLWWSLQSGERIQAGLVPAVWEPTTSARLDLVKVPPTGFQLVDRVSRRPASPALASRVGTISAFALSPDGAHFAVAGERGEVQLWRLAPLEAVGEPWRGLPAPAEDLAFSPDGQWLASAHLATLALWQVAPRLALGEIVASEGMEPSTAKAPIEVPRGLAPPCAGAVSAVSEGRSRSEILLGCEDGATLVVENPSEGAPRVLARLAGPLAAVTHLAIDPSGHLVASADRNGGLWLWDLDLELLIAGPWYGHATPVVALAFEPSRKALVSQSSDGVHVRWNIDFDDWQESACRIANRGWRREEWQVLALRFLLEFEPLCAHLPSELPLPAP